MNCLQEFKENLLTGGQAYLSGNYRKAADFYKAAYEVVGLRYLVSITINFKADYSEIINHMWLMILEKIFKSLTTSGYLKKMYSSTMVELYIFFKYPLI